MKSNIALFGLGIIGSRCADCLIEQGHRVRTWNRTAKDRPESVADPVAAAEGAEFIAFYLKDGIAVREVFSTLKKSILPSQTVLNHSTIDLDTTKWLETECKELGCSFLDAPFTGSKLAAAHGELVYYVGGNPETLEQAREVMQATSKEIKHLGPVGSATVVKIATNLISASTVQALSEALAIVSHHGIAPEAFTESVASNASGSLLASMKLPSMAAGNYETHFSLGNMLKDSRFALQLADNAGLETPGIKATAEAMDSRCKKGDEHLDFSALYKAYERQ